MGRLNQYSNIEYFNIHSKYWNIGNQYWNISNISINIRILVERLGPSGHGYNIEILKYSNIWNVGTKFECFQYFQYSNIG